MDTQKYQAFLKVTELGNITRAAEELGYSQSGVTQMLASLEETLDIYLFERTNKGVKLTESGKHLLPFFEGLVRDQRNVEEEVLRLKGMETGELTIGSYASIAAEWLPRILSSFSKEHPAIKVQIATGNNFELLDLLSSGKIEIAYTIYEKHEGFEGRMLSRDKYLVTISEKNPLAKKKHISSKDLQDEIVLGNNYDGVIDPEVRDFVGSREVGWGTQYGCDMDEVMHNMVKQNIGIMLSSELMISGRNKDGIVTRPLSPNQERILGYYVKNRSKLSFAARSFLEHTDAMFPEA